MWLLLLLLLCASACTRPAGTPLDPTIQSDHQAPFQPSGTPTATADPETALAAPDRGPMSAGTNPALHDLQGLPLGTLLTIRLTSPVYAESSISSSSFRGVVSEAVVIGGNTVIPRGATVAGLVESVRASEVKPSRGYVRMALQSVQFGGSELSLHTASLFAPPAKSPGPAPSWIRLERGRQLTFRVSEPPYPLDQQAKK